MNINEWFSFLALNRDKVNELDSQKSQSPARRKFMLGVGSMSISAAFGQPAVKIAGKVLGQNASSSASVVSLADEISKFCNDFLYDRHWLQGGCKQGIDIASTVKDAGQLEASLSKVKSNIKHLLDYRGDQGSFIDLLSERERQALRAIIVKGNDFQTLCAQLGDGNFVGFEDDLKRALVNTIDGEHSSAVLKKSAERHVRDFHRVAGQASRNIRISKQQSSLKKDFMEEAAVDYAVEYVVSPINMPVPYPYGYRVKANSSAGDSLVGVKKRFEGVSRADGEFKECIRSTSQVSKIDPKLLINI